MENAGVEKSGAESKGGKREAIGLGNSASQPEFTSILTDLNTESHSEFECNNTLITYRSISIISNLSASYRHSLDGQDIANGP